MKQQTHRLLYILARRLLFGLFGIIVWSAIYLVALLTGVLMLVIASRFI